MTLFNPHIKRSAFVLTFFIATTLCAAQTFSKEQLLGKITPSKDTNFTLIAAKHTDKKNIYLNKKAYKAFEEMSAAAAKEGIQIKIISATRTFEAQKAIWEKKWVRSDYVKFPEQQRVKEIMKYSSMPGTSRHHWGTDIDINSLENSYFEKTEGKKLYQWMLANAASFGFYQTYTSKSGGRTGYEEEKWHWSYLPIAEPMLTEYQKTIEYNDINGFSGSQYAAVNKVIEEYVLGILK
ncbi:MAG: M15 family metallopeptidase [Flavobacteriales bacterium]|jgi:D-alanyl-D-alanine carboxypeptidase